MYAGVTALFRARAVRLGVPRFSAAAPSPRTSGHRHPHPLRSLHLSSSTARSTAAAAPTDPKDTDASPAAAAAVKAHLSHTNLARNNEIRFAYRDRTPEVEAAIEEMLGTAYVPPARAYPTGEATALSLRRARRVARVRVGEEMLLARRGGRPRPPRRDAADTLALLKRMTPPVGGGARSAMHAMRIVLPRAWELAGPGSDGGGSNTTSSKSVEYVAARTGLAARLRMTGDRDDATAVVLRGRAAVLAQAADEIIAACRDVEVFQLGEVTSVDYATQRLWPVIEGGSGTANNGSSVLDKQEEGIWLHKEEQYWIDVPYEKTPRPTEWTVASFDAYVKSLVYGRLRPGRTPPHAQHTDGQRARMLMAAFEDPAARRCIAPPTLNAALRFLTAHGGYRAHAERLLAQAERWGVPLDADAFHVLLESYARTHDARYFHKTLVKMRERCFCPDARTWLHLLRLVQRDDTRLQVEAAMFDLGLFKDDDSSTRREVAIVTAGAAAYKAFRAGETLPSFLDKQIARFGAQWLTDEAAEAVLREFFLFHPTPAASKRYLDHRVMIERMAEHGGQPGISISTLNLILEHCAQPHVLDWDTALWALSRAPLAPAVGERAAVATTYRHLVDLCLRSPHASTSLAAVVFFAVAERALTSRPGRTAVAQALLAKDGAWAARPPRLLSRDMADALRKAPVEAKKHAVRGVEAAIRDATRGYAPAERLVDVLRRARELDGRHEGGATAAAEEEGEGHAPDEPALTIALVGVDEDDGSLSPLPRTEVRLDSAFDVRRMVVYNQHAKPPWLKERKKSGGATVATNGSSEAVGSSAETEDKTAAAQDGQKKRDGGSHPLVQYLNSLH